MFPEAAPQTVGKFLDSIENFTRCHKAVVREALHFGDSRVRSSSQRDELEDGAFPLPVRGTLAYDGYNYFILLQDQREQEGQVVFGRVTENLSWADHLVGNYGTQTDEEEPQEEILINAAGML